MDKQATLEQIRQEAFNDEFNKLAKMSENKKIILSGAGGIASGAGIASLIGRSLHKKSVNNIISKYENGLATILRRM